MPEQRPTSELCAKYRIARPSRALMLFAAATRSLETRGVLGTARRVGQVTGVVPTQARPRRPLEEDECLGLQPGDVVEVKTAEEIRRTLDRFDANRGLYFMEEMWGLCGQRFTVLKRVDRIMAESTGQIRNGIKNTVLLEGACCDGSAHGGCGANCFHFWREVWLKRPDEDGTAMT